jgi:TPR repeat protein
LLFFANAARHFLPGTERQQMRSIRPLLALVILFAPAAFAAPQGDAVAQYKLGEAYRLGQDVPRDYAEAARWFRKAADQGDASAQYSLGEMSYKGQGVTQDYAEAVKWYRKIADQGESPDVALFQGTVALNYEDGKGVPQDYVLAHMWYNLAASRSGPWQTMESRGRDRVAAKMTAAQIAEAQRLAREWKPAARE